MVMSEDGKSDSALRPFYPVRVLISKQASHKPNWSARHTDSDTGWDDTVTEPDGRFLAVINPSQIARQPGRAAEFQIGLCLGFGKGKTLTWSATTSVLNSSVTHVSINGPRVLSPIQRAINGSPSPASHRFDPAALIAAVNALQSLGKDRAITELRQFVSMASDSPFARRDAENIDTSDGQCVFLIVRLLFEPSDPTERHPRMMIGQPMSLDQPDPPDESVAPLAVSNGFPFILVNGYALGGLPEPPSAHVDWADKHGRLRVSPMRPTSTADSAAEELINRLRWDPNGRGAAALRKQATLASQTLKGTKLSGEN